MKLGLREMGMSPHEENPAGGTGMGGKHGGFPETWGCDEF